MEGTYVSKCPVNADRLVHLVEMACDDNASDTDLVELDTILRGDHLLRCWYLEFCQMRVALRLNLRARRAAQKLRQQMSTDQDPPDFSEPDVMGGEVSLPLPRPTFLPTPSYGTTNYFTDGWPVAYSLAAVIFGLGLVVAAVTYVSQPVYVASTLPTVQKGRSVPGPNAPCVGRITGMVDCNWKGSSRIVLGQKCQLASGLMEIAYDTGAKVILQGPVTYSVEANGGYLAVGKLTGKLEKKGEGGRRKAEEAGDQKSPFPLPPSPFIIRTPTATVTDLGTEFGVEVSDRGATETHVFVGEVQMVTGSGQGNSDRQTRVISAGQSAHGTQ